MGDPFFADKTIIARLNNEIVKALAVPEVRDRLLSFGAEIVGSTPEEFGAFMQAEIAKQGKVAHAAHIRVD